MFTRLLKYMIRDGSLRWIDGKGRTHVFGDGSAPGCTVRVTRRSLDWTLMLNPGLAVPEALMEGDLVIEEGTVYDFIDLAARNYRRLEAHPLVRLVKRLDPAQLGQYNPVGRARRNVAHHYDLSDALYELFLDSDRQYSCAYFERESDDIETAQQAKKRHIASKLRLKPGLKVLDIGSGWGGLGLYLARTGGVDVTGLTLSTEQYAVSSRRAAEAELSDRVRFRLQDYREETGTYDRIVSVGMFEHVGRQHFVDYYKAIGRMLKPGGLALVHSIIKPARSRTNAWFRKYIFPGGLIPRLDDMTASAEAARLVRPQEPFVHDGRQYATTLRHWRKRFNENFGSLDHNRYDERFRRLWNFYLAGSEAAFDALGYRVAQMVVEKPT